MKYNAVAITNESTVVAEYTPEKTRSEAYQSEAELEQEFIRLLTEQGYEYLKIHDENSLIKNLRQRLEALNHYIFTDDEWARLFEGYIANKNETQLEKTRKIHEDYKFPLNCDDGKIRNIYLIDKENIHNNFLQVINQYEEKYGARETRYDVTVLVNGLPLVHIELKRRGVALTEAFNQIERYQRDSFWASSGLYEYVQIFVISNGTHTKYYSNTTRLNHVNGLAQNKNTKTSGAANSFEFTSFWADANNKPISDLVDFTKTFFARHTILNILTKYCVFTSENALLVMRPYQITATERILSKIEIANNYKKAGTIEACGYIWHTTGSGKTLTSFKTAVLASSLPYISKVLFVVDRKDLDYQTMKEYDRFKEGAANSNTSTKILEQQLTDPNCKIVITTIQKLNVFISKNKFHPIYNSNVVIVFDECHRSQFGLMHSNIVKNFKKYYLFGFTGTPIFAVNLPANIIQNQSSKLAPAIISKTTEQIFGDCLHSYTIVNAINDNNVLPFRVDYVGSVHEKEDIADDKVHDIDKEAAFLKPKRIEKIVSYILDHFDQQTKRHDQAFSVKIATNINELAEQKLSNDVQEIKKSITIKGFNSIFTVSSIKAAMLYYTEFQRQMTMRPEKRLKVATIYSYGANEEIQAGLLSEENSEDTGALDKTSRDFLDSAIKDYNSMFKTNYDTSSEKFQSYYKDVSLRMKNREIDLLIVVNMFLTGFDSKLTNTLWVDKNLHQHGLIQAFSRTNRILNKVKNCGNIVCFRNLSEETDEAIALFADENARGLALLRPYSDYYNGYTDEEDVKHSGYVDIVKRLVNDFGLPLSLEDINTAKRKAEFIKLYNAFLRFKNILSSFDDFAGNEILSEREIQDYQSCYLDLHQEISKNRLADSENINDDIVFEMDLIRQVDINIDYILMLVAKYHISNCQNKEILVSIEKSVDSSMSLRSKKELIKEFIEEIKHPESIHDEWASFIKAKKEAELDEIIKTQHLNFEQTHAFIDNAFQVGSLKTTGTDIVKILPRVSMFGSSNRDEVKKKVIELLLNFFEKYYNMI